MSEQSRRFTDREVALVLKRASELDDTDGGEAAGGLSLEDLREIANEVGISTDAIDGAVASLERGRRISPSLAGAPRVRKSVHAVRGELNQEGIAKLMQIVDERTDNAGAISEALGSVRWTGQDRFKSTRVSITPRAGETTIEVVEKVEPRLRRIFHFLPAAWGVIFAAPVIVSMGPAGAAALAAGAMLAGAGIGRGVWSLLSASSGRRVKRLAESIADAARGAATQGLVTEQRDDD